MGDGADHDEVFLPFARPDIDEDDITAVAAVLRSGWLTAGPAVRRFEEALADRVGVPYVIACASGTAGLHLAALAAGLGPGDAVAIPSLTALATANAFLATGADVILCDIDPDTGLMRPADLQAALPEHRRVNAICPVDLNGQPADPPGMAAAAAEIRAVVIEDAAHAFGTTYERQGETVAVGGCRDAAMTVFSFHPTKMLAMGEGGAVCTADHELAARLRRFRDHGMERTPIAFEGRSIAFDRSGAPNPWYYELHVPGMNYRVSDIHCALGLSQLRRLDSFIARRRALVEKYDRLLAPFAPVVRPVARVPGAAPCWHLYVALIDFEAVPVERSEVVLGLRSVGIGSMVHYVPLHLQPYFIRRYGAQELPGAEKYYSQALSLPLFPAMEDADVDRVVESLTRVLGLV
ncbi:MAG: UDP-4-amino-4,6-dideoxy-N-acetyl-beta-L-altrosamine transaminase [Rhodospirillaceae bacterium]|nr:UDP-4-amino-4,6-dideoxy-N-acetyl-beta-L-altrosamine transaminase [Rhodospirillaceae bacterium]